MTYIIQIIAMWTFLGAIFFTCSNTPKLFRNKRWAVIAHGPLVWYAALCARIINDPLDIKNPKDKT